MSGIVKTMAVGVLAGCMLPAYAGALEDGLRLYSTGRYGESAASLERAENSDPGNPAIHYYLANCLVYLKKHDRAIDEYAICYALDKNGQLGRFSRAALEQYGEAVPNDNRVARIRATMGGATAAARAVGGTHASPCNDAVQNSLSVIRRQLQLEKMKHESLSEANAEDALTAAKNAARAVEEEAERQVQRLYVPQPRRLAYQGDLQAREARIRAEAKAEQEWIMRQAQIKAERCRKVGEMQKSALEQVADNLEKQMRDDGSRSGIKLVPAGTNLYVRSYAAVGSTKSTPEVHAAVARIYADSSGTQGSAQADSSGDMVEQTVQAKLVRRQRP